MIRKITFSFLLITALILNSCASAYMKINPETINYASKSIDKDVLLEYKYDLLQKKYKKKETKNEVRLIAVKITNNTEKDIVFGQDVLLTYENGNELNVIETQKLFKTIKQSPASYLWYLLLSPVQVFSTSSNSSNGGSETRNSFPLGLILGPGLAGGNIVAATTANKNFKNELTAFDISGKTITKGQTIYGLIGVNSNTYDTIKIVMQ